MTYHDDRHAPIASSSSAACSRAARGRRRRSRPDASCADGVPVRKPSEEISTAAAIEAEPEHPYVSRGGVKLAAALDHFHLDVAGRVCLDVGASTGGFTEVLLERGARRVYAVDVGRGQLHRSPARPAEIVSLEATDIRKLDPSRLAEPPDFATVDVSFISLKLVLPAIGKLAASRAQRSWR